MVRVILRHHVDVIVVSKEVLGAQERVGERAVRVINQGRQGKGFGVRRLVRVFVRVMLGLDVEEFFAQGR